MMIFLMFNPNSIIMKTIINISILIATLFAACQKPQSMQNDGSTEKESANLKVVYLIDNSLSNPAYFIERPTIEELSQFYELIGSVGGEIYVGRIGTTRLSQSPFSSYYNCWLPVKKPSENALYREKMRIREENDANLEDFSKQKEAFVNQTYETYVFNERQTDIVTAVKRSLIKLNNKSQGGRNMMIIHSDMIHDIGKPKPYTLIIPEDVSVQIIGKAYSSLVKFSSDSNIKFHDTFNDFLHYLKTQGHENK
jgi:hypothetical protein